MNSLIIEEVLSALEYAVFKPLSVLPTKREDIGGSAFPLLKRKGECKPQLLPSWYSMKLSKAMFRSTPKTFSGNSQEVRDLVDNIKTKLTRQLDLLMYQQE